MKRIIYLALMALIYQGLPVAAQEKRLSIGFAGQVVIPTGDFAKSEGGGAATGGGGILSGQFALNRQISLGVEVGYNAFGETTEYGVSSSATTTPILFRAKAFLAPEGNFRPYFTGALGFSDVSFNWSDDEESIGGSSSVLAFSVGLGAEARANDNLFWDFSLTFNSAQTDGKTFDFDGYDVMPEFNSTYIAASVGVRIGL